MTSTSTVTAAGTSNSLGDVIAWMEHEHRLLEILAYRVDGLTNMLRAQQHAMICQAASDVDEVQDQLAHAAVQRDIAVVALTARWGTPGTATLGALLEIAPEAERAAAAELRAKIQEAAATVEAARARCFLAAETYRPSE